MREAGICLACGDDIEIIPIKRGSTLMFYPSYTQLALICRACAHDPKEDNND